MKTRPSSFFFGLAFALALARPAQAVYTVKSALTVGEYQDLSKQQHTPFYFTLSASGIHAREVRTNIDLILHRDLSRADWNPYLSGASAAIPFGRWQSEVRLGRQLFLEGFDFSLLDGVDAPLYLGPAAGVVAYGGVTRDMDLDVGQSRALAGLTAFFPTAGADLRAGYSGRGAGLAEKSAYASASRAWQDAPLAPQLLLKADSESFTSLRQLLADLGVQPAETFFLSAAYSRRNPRQVVDRQQSLYQLLASSAATSARGTARWALHPGWEASLVADFLGYDSQLRHDTGSLQEIGFTWKPGPAHRVRPSFGRIRSYGGTIWNSSLGYEYFFRESASYFTDLSASFLDKINSIRGWSYEWRNGLSTTVSRRWTALAWLELARNHLFAFDGRVIASVAYFR